MSIITAEIIELVWTLLSLCGLILHIIGVRRASMDLKAVRLLGLTGPRMIISRGHLRNEVVRMLIQVIFLVIGLSALASPHIARDSVPLASMILIIGFISVGLAMIGLTLLEFADRRTLIEMELQRLSDIKDGNIPQE